MAFMPCFPATFALGRPIGMLNRGDLVRVVTYTHVRGPGHKKVYCVVLAPVKASLTTQIIVESPTKDLMMEA